jgi:hypothetical protein
MNAYESLRRTNVGHKLSLVVILAFQLILGATTAQAADGYPSRPIQIIVPFGPGGIGDNISRTLANGLSAKLGQPVIVSNQAGRSSGGGFGSLAAANFRSTKADGYTLFLWASGYETLKGLPSLPIATIGTKAFVANAQIAPQPGSPANGSIVLYGLVAPLGTPTQVAERLNVVTEEVRASAQNQLLDLGVQIMARPLADFAESIKTGASPSPVVVPPSQVAITAPRPSKVVLPSSTTPAAGGRRVALVIGNNAYRDMPSLFNAGNDAQAVGDVLRKIGFEVTTKTDLDRVGMNDAMSRFTRQISSAEVVFFYYSGHGMQFGGQNFLLPIDAKLSGPEDVNRFQLFPLDDLLETLQAL